MTSGLLRQVYEKIANIGKQTLHKESEEFNMKKKVLSVILAAVCTMGLMAGCGAEGSKGSTPVSYTHLKHDDENRDICICRAASTNRLVAHG